ncbi:hypothetical protein Nepgr_031551 [Nepenthes gracilis]|uniref:Uncharacterized protein n=1 Tax=Nepenthes gracilis TaxID=150966 RepID=A0AAD3TIP8_NEPGR|nr:hypothetical protein Nepgr_031551 [Nepenthes gracilis]
MASAEPPSVHETGGQSVIGQITTSGTLVEAQDAQVGDVLVPTPLHVQVGPPVCLAIVEGNVGVAGIVEASHPESLVSNPAAFSSKPGIGEHQPVWQFTSDSTISSSRPTLVGRRPDRQSAPTSVVSFLTDDKMLDPLKIGLH